MVAARSLLVRAALLGLLLSTCTADAAARAPNGPRRAFVLVPRTESLPPLLAELLTLRPERVTRMIGSHDPCGTNRDNACEGMPTEGDWRVMFHARGEGRIVRLWMNADDELDVPHDWQELEIVTDGVVRYRGAPLDYFRGKGPWQAPLVLDHPQSSGAYLSLVPFPYEHEAKIRLRGYPQFYQVSWQEGPGASVGASAEETARFLREEWWTSAPPASDGHRLDVEHPARLATGPILVRALTVHVDEAALGRLILRVGEQRFPATMFFGFATARTDPKGLADAHPIAWPQIHSALIHSEPKNGLLRARIPIPLRAGETFALEATAGAPIDVATGVDAVADPLVEASGVRFLADAREQYGPGTETTLPLFEAKGAVEMLSLVDETAEGIPGNRGFLEGDEMVRVDSMRYPLYLGTGTEDYFNGGWYFFGVHSNPLSGLTRFEVRHDERGWAHALFEHSMYRHHVLDPIVARDGLRFGIEAGETGSYAPIFFRTLALGYGWPTPQPIARARFVLDAAQGEGSRFGEPERWVRSPIDAERGQPPIDFPVRARRDVTRLTVPCPAGAPPSGMLLVRDYDQSVGGQSATVRVGGTLGDPFTEIFRNVDRRFAQDEKWIALGPGDCETGSLRIDVDARGAPVPFVESAYEVVLFR